jgi:hypothetical protein
MNLYPWQLDMLDKMTKYKGKGLIQITGRQMGKSAFSAQAIERLMRDLNSQPVSDLVLGEGKWHGARYYTVEPIGGNWLDMQSWAQSAYGEPGSVWSNDTLRWYANDRKFWFRNEADRTMFVLKWR